VWKLKKMQGIDRTETVVMSPDRVEICEVGCRRVGREESAMRLLSNDGTAPPGCFSHLRIPKEIEARFLHLRIAKELEKIPPCGSRVGPEYSIDIIPRTV